jgi:hypothetical protein
MASAKPSKTLADYVTIALSPVLIMALVGSLVFFLLEVLYVGQYSGRLQWTLFFFVFGIVLISRVSIEIGGGRALIYGLALAAVVFLALQAYLEYPAGGPTVAFGWAINLGLMALSWWCAHRLTWDCTYIEDSVDATGKGVLEAAGLDESTAPAEPAQELEVASQERPKQYESRALFGLLAWWDRYRRYSEEQRRQPHTPGVWVVYFSLAALPLFGLGQSLIPAADEARRRYAFWLMVCYVGGGLGLLLTTSFLGLRRYLRQRKLKMPAAMTGMWIAVGGGLIAVLLLVGALLPRPYGEYQLINITPLGSPGRDASDFALKRDGAGQGEGRPSSDPSRGDQKAEPGSGNKPEPDGQGTAPGKSGNDKSAKEGSASGNKQGNKQNREMNGGSQGQDTSKGDANSEDGKDQTGDKRGDKGGGERDPKQEGSKPNDSREEEKNSRDGSSPANQKLFQHQPEQNQSRGGSPTPPSNPAFGLLAKLGWLATLLKWILFTVLALVVAFYLLRSGLRFLANFTNWARQLLDAFQVWWQNLFRSAKTQEGLQPSGEIEEKQASPLPFASFSNPFVDGSADRLTPSELARYSFEALESWAWEHGLGRQPQETPIEFSERLAAEVPALETGARRLAGLYARAAYAHVPLTTGCLRLLKQFWQGIESVGEKSLSA